MRSIADINTRMQEIIGRIELLQKAISEEKSKRFFERSFTQLNFLHHQKSICISMLSEYKWIMENAESKKEDF